MFRLNQTLHAQRRLEALLQGRRSQKERRSGDPAPVKAPNERPTPPAASNYLDRRRRRIRRNQAA